MGITTKGYKLQPFWYYGFSYKPVNKFALVYHIIPFNYLARFWFRLNQFKYKLLWFLISIKPVRGFILKKIEAKK